MNRKLLKLQFLIFLIIYLIVVFGWIFGPYGPIRILIDVGFENIDNRNIPDFFGWCFLILMFSLAPIMIFGKALLKTFNKIDRYHDTESEKLQALLTILIPFFFFLFTTFIVHNPFIKLTAFNSTPIIERFLSLEEIFKLGVFIGLFYFIFSLLIPDPEILYVYFGRKSKLRNTLDHTIIYLLYLLCIISLGILTVAFNQALDRVLALIIDLIANFTQSQVQREHGPGLSRDLPYTIALVMIFLSAFVVNYFTLILYPYKISLKILRYIQKIF